MTTPAASENKDLVAAFAARVSTSKFIHYEYDNKDAVCNQVARWLIDDCEENAWDLNPAAWTDEEIDDYVSGCFEEDGYEPYSLNRH